MSRVPPFQTIQSYIQQYKFMDLAPFKVFLEKKNLCDMFVSMRFKEPATTDRKHTVLAGRQLGGHKYRSALKQTKQEWLPSKRHCILTL